MTSGEPHLPNTRWRTVVVALIGALGITLSLTVFFRVWRFEQANLQNEFSQRATAGATAIQRGVQEHLAVLYSLGAVYTAASRPLNREVFRELTQGTLKRYPGVQGLGWIPRVSEAERETYLAAAQQDGMVDFEITEWTPRWQVVRAARRDVYYPLFYIEPLESHRATLGFNLGSVPSYMEAMQKALSTGEAVASAWRSLAQDTGEQFGFLLFLPVYKSGAPRGTFEARRASLQGFTMAIFPLRTLVEQSLQGMGVENIGLDLSDVTDAASRYLLSLQFSASHVASWAFSLRQSAKAEAIRAGLHWETTFNVAGRRWSVLFYPIPEAWHTPSWQAWGVLVGALLFTLLCARFLLLKWR